MKVFIVLALTLIGIIATLPGVDPSCPPPYIFGSQCAAFSWMVSTYADASYVCGSIGGTIFEIRNETSYDFLAKHARVLTMKLWVGAKKVTEGDWRLPSDNSTVTLPKKWFAPGEECLQIEPSGELRKQDCDKTFGFFCLK